MSLCDMVGGVYQLHTCTTFVRELTIFYEQVCGRKKYENCESTCKYWVKTSAVEFRGEILKLLVQARRSNSC